MSKCVYSFKQPSFLGVHWLSSMPIGRKVTVCSDLTKPSMSSLFWFPLSLLALEQSNITFYLYSIETIFLSSLLGYYSIIDKLAKRRGRPIISIVSVCLSVCLLDDNFQKP